MAPPAAHRGLVRAVIGAAVLLVVLLGLLLFAGRPTTGVLDGVAVEGRDVSGAGRDELRGVVDDLAQERLQQPVVVEGERATAQATRAEVGDTVDREATVEEAWSRGRGLLTGLMDRLRARFGATIDVELRAAVDEPAVTAWAQATAEEQTSPVQEGEVRLVTDPAPGVEVTEPAVGEVVDGEALAEALLDALESDPGAVRLDAPSTTEQPVVGQADVEAVLPAARRAVSASVDLANPAGGAGLELPPPALARVLLVARAEQAPAGERLVVRGDAEALLGVIGDDLGAIEVEPAEARFAIEGQTVSVEGGTPGFELDPRATADRVAELATSDGPRTGELPGERVEPEFTRAEAEAMGITEQVSTFTTGYPCCPPRVTNIQLAAQILDDTIVSAGDTYSLDEGLGPRTPDRGFVEAGVIQDGEFTDAIGGGLSQFATTFFNTAFFAGIELVEHQPHSYYIERYPMGRESTISAGAIDVVVTNDSPHAILIKSAANDTSVTVTFFSTPWAEVEAFDSGPYDVVEGEVRDGFTIDYGRVVTYPDGSSETEEWTHTYEAQDDDEDEDEGEPDEGA